MEAAKELAVQQTLKAAEVSTCLLEELEVERESVASLWVQLKDAEV